MAPPATPKVYHIVHVDRLASIVADGCLWSDREVVARTPAGTTIGMNRIKRRRLNEIRLQSHPTLFVGDCVPFYFGPRSVMLYLLWRGNHVEVEYRGGQTPIIHLEGDLGASVAWAIEADRRWAFTTSNAGSYYAEDYAHLDHLDKVDWTAVDARNWSQCRERKQAEFLIEQSFPWHLVERVGVHSRPVYQQVVSLLPANGHRPVVEIRPDWYY